MKHGAVPLFRRIVALGGAMLMLLPAAPAPAASPEVQVKAAYIYKFASFVRWPDSAENEFRFCVSGRSDVAAVLKELVRGQSIGGRAATVVQLQPGQDQLARSCRILFLGRGAETAGAMIKATGDMPVLTVCDRNSGTRGGVIDFVLRDGKVRFTIDRALADKRRLDLNARLLEVAVGAQ